MAFYLVSDQANFHKKKTYVLGKIFIWRNIMQHTSQNYCNKYSRGALETS
jgi:hypothetical protein